MKPQTSDFFFQNRIRWSLKHPKRRLTETGLLFASLQID